MSANGEDKTRVSFDSVRLDELASDSEAADQLVGKVVGERYEVLSRLAAGGMGVVYRGVHRLMKKPVAIKVLTAESLKDKTAVERFQQEAQLSSRLSHLNVVSVHDFGVDNGCPFLVMDFVEGKPLSQMLDKKSGVRADQAIDWMIQVCHGMEHAHEYGLIHRDLKPSNVMLVKSPEGKDVVKVLDFGLAKSAVPEGDKQALTQSGMVMGSCMYMSPEQCGGKPADARSDIYALGCMLYELLTGKPPLVGENLLETLQMQIGQMPTLMRDSRPDLNIPDPLESVVSKALAKDPSQRFQTVSEMRQALEQANVSSPPSGGKSGISAPAGAQKKWAIAAAAVVLLGIAGVYLVQSSRNTDTADKPASDSPIKLSWLHHYQDALKAFDAGEFAREEQLLRLALPEAKQMPGNTELLRTMHTLADSLYAQQKYADGDKIEADIRSMNNLPAASDSRQTPQSKATASKKPESEDDHLANLAMVCHKNGQCDVASQLLERSVSVSKRAYGPTSPQTVARLSELASFYIGLGETDKAEPILNQVMAIKAQKK